MNKETKFSDKKAAKIEWSFLLKLMAVSSMAITIIFTVYILIMIENAYTITPDIQAIIDKGTEPIWPIVQQKIEFAKSKLIYPMISLIVSIILNVVEIFVKVINVMKKPT